MGFGGIGGDWNMTFLFPYIGNFIIPTDFSCFRGVETTNQTLWICIWSCFTWCFGNHNFLEAIWRLLGGGDVSLKLAAGRPLPSPGSGGRRESNTQPVPGQSGKWFRSNEMGVVMGRWSKPVDPSERMP